MFESMYKYACKIGTVILLFSRKYNLQYFVLYLLSPVYNCHTMQVFEETDELGRKLQNISEGTVCPIPSFDGSTKFYRAEQN